MPMHKPLNLDHIHHAAIYVCCSSYGQAKQDLDFQEKVCRQRAENSQLHVVSVYTDEHTRAHKAGCHALHQLMADATTDAFRFVIVFSYDYLARNSYELALALMHLEAHSVRVIPAIDFPPFDNERIVHQAYLRENIAKYTNALTAAEKRTLATARLAENNLALAVNQALCIFPKHKLICDKCAAPMTLIKTKHPNGNASLGYACTNQLDDTCYKAVEDKTVLEQRIIEQAMTVMLTPHNIEITAQKIANFHIQEFGDETIDSLALLIDELQEQSKPMDMPNFSPERRKALKRLSQAAKISLPDAKLNLVKLRAANEIPQPVKTIRNWLVQLGDGDPCDPAFRRYFFDNFVRTAWVNDNRILVALNITLPNRAAGIAPVDASIAGEYADAVKPHVHLY